MFKPPLLAILIILAGHFNINSNHVLAAELTTPLPIFEENKFTCKNWLASRKFPKGNIAVSMRIWLSGWLSAYNNYATSSVKLPSTNLTKEHLSILNDFCRKNTTATIVTAATHLVSEMKRIKK